jgi:hypothetical protein
MGETEAGVVLIILYSYCNYICQKYLWNRIGLCLLPCSLSKESSQANEFRFKNYNFLCQIAFPFRTGTKWNSFSEFFLWKRPHPYLFVVWLLRSSMRMVSYSVWWVNSRLKMSDFHVLYGKKAATTNILTEVDSLQISSTCWQQYQFSLDWNSSGILLSSYKIMTRHWSMYHSSRCVGCVRSEGTCPVGETSNVI